MRHLLFAIVPVLVAPIAISAQIATTTALVGTVTDPSGNVVPGAAVAAVNIATGDTYNAATNEAGYYNIQFVRIGTYEITVKQPGFQTFRATKIEVSTNQVVRTDVVLQVGELVQTVDVESVSIAIKTDDATVGEILNTRSVADLPLNGRDPLRLALTTPGVVPGLKGTTGVPPGQDFIGAGTREIQNSLSLDGISIVNNLITTTPVRPSVDSVQEVEVQTGTYSAQYGAYMGVHINLVSKSGTNAIHGNVVEFLRNDKLDARPFFLSPTAKKTPLRQNQFGFELDGPLFIPRLYDGRNKTFFMGSYEGLREIRQNATIGTLLTPQMWQGNFSQTTTVVRDTANNNTPFPGNVIPAERLSAIVQKLRQYYPTPSINSITNNFPTTIPANQSTNQTVDRLDQNVGDRVRLYFRYQMQTMHLFAGSINPFNSTTGVWDSNNFSVGYTHTLRPNVVNEFRFGRQYVKTDSLNHFYVNGLKDAGSQLGIPGYDGDVRFNNPGIPDFNITGFTGFGNGGTNWFQDDVTWQASDQVSWTRGAHTIMGGAEFRKLQTGRAAVNSARGTFTFTGQFAGYAPADFMLGIQQQNVTPGPEIYGVVAGWRDGFFVLDKWQATRKLTLNIGLRYELPTVPYSVNGYHTKLNPSQTELIPANPPQPGFKFINPTHKNFAPRFGIAFRLTEKTVLRGGYGIYYNPNQTNTYTFLNTNPPFSPVVTYVSLPTTPTLSLTNPTPPGSANIPPPPNVITHYPDLPTAYMNQWSFGIDRELWRGSALELQYLGSHSMHLDRNFFNNTPLPGPGPVNPRRPNPRFTVIRTIQNDVIANYEALSVGVRQRMRRGLQFHASYTWAHTLDVTTDSNGGGTNMNPYNWRQDYGNSNWDIRHRLTGAFVYDVPFFATTNRAVKFAFANWQMNGLFVAQSGLPFNVSIGTDTANTASGGTYRPDLVAKPTSDCGGHRLVNCINSSAFAVPQLYTYGSAGRNLLHGPSLFTIDFSVFKNFRIWERAGIQFRAEFFNLLNHPNFSNPAATFNTGTFGSITSTRTENRDIQFGLKLYF